MVYLYCVAEEGGAPGVVLMALPCLPTYLLTHLVIGSKRAHVLVAHYLLRYAAVDEAGFNVGHQGMPLVQRCAGIAQ